MNSEMVLDSNQYWITNAHVPASLLTSEAGLETAFRTWEDLVLVNIEVTNGIITQIADSHLKPNLNSYNLQGGQLWPCFVDLHTHLDKGHIWPRSPNPDGTFNTALETIPKDAEKNWDYDDIYTRMEFGLKCSYAHGTKAVRTHIDTVGSHFHYSWEAFKVLREKWQDKIILQAVSLLPLDIFTTPEGEKLADKIVEFGGVLGGVSYMNPDLESQLNRVFALATERGLNLDFHVDESTNPDDMTLRYIATTAIRHQFSGQVVCGHCCSLSVQSPAEVTKTLQLVKEAKIGIVSLPMCNLYLQDRQPQRTPRLRGVTLLHEMKAIGIPTALASDNCRDPFYGFGDHDALEVFTESVRIAHLDMPYGDWPLAVTSSPANLMKLPEVGRIGVGLPADLVLFKGRNFSELLSRPQGDRIVLRNGKPIDTTLPDYAELDGLKDFPAIYQQLSQS